MNGVLSRDQSDGFARWVLPEVNDAPPPPEPEPAPPTPAPTVFELEQIQQQAHAEGYAAGLAEGRAAASAELAQRLTRLDALCAAAAQPLLGLDDEAERELAWLATRIARQLVGRELRTDPALVVDAVRRAAAALPAASRELRVAVHPQDLDLLHELAAAEPHWRFVADPALSRGDCVLESASSRLDARVSSRLDVLIEAALGTDAGGLEPAPEDDPA